MAVVSVPSIFADLLGPVDGADVLTWDMTEAPERAGEIEVAVVPPFGARWLSRLDELPALRAVVTATAGYEHVRPHLPPGVVLANAVGVHDTATAELGLGLMIAAQRELPDMVRAQDRGEWLAPRVRRSLADSSALVLGYGGVGRALAARLRACEVAVTAVATRARGGDAHVDRVHQVEELGSLLPAHDVLAVTLPLTDDTRGLVDGGVLAALPDDALVVNLGRGGVVDTEALLAELQAGRLRAALDVTDPEPLPEGHPLWAAPGVLISHHTGGSSRAFPSRGAAYVRRQLERYVETGTIDHVVATGAAPESAGTDLSEGAVSR